MSSQKQLISTLIVFLLFLITPIQSRTIHPLQLIEGANLMSNYFNQSLHYLEIQPQSSLNVFSQCHLCSKKFKNSTYLSLHLLLHHINHSSLIPYDKVCRFMQCKSSNKISNLSNQMKMQLCISWMIQYSNMTSSIPTVKEIKQIDRICKQFIFYEPESRFNWLWKMVWIIFVVSSIVFSISYMRQNFLKNKHKKLSTKQQ